MLHLMHLEKKQRNAEAHGAELSRAHYGTPKFSEISQDSIESVAFMMSSLGNPTTGRKKADTDKKKEEFSPGEQSIPLRLVMKSLKRASVPCES